MRRDVNENKLILESHGNEAAAQDVRWVFDVCSPLVRGAMQRPSRANTEPPHSHSSLCLRRSS